jgi:protein SCO1
VLAPREEAVTRPNGSSRAWIWSVFAVLLLSIPAAAVLIARARRDQLPSFGPVPAFVLQDQTGAQFDSRSLAGKVWVADFIFTSCSQICPRLTEEMAKIQRYVINRGLDNRVNLISISVDPERDTVERLAGYAKGFLAQPSVWKFLTGSQKEIEDAVVKGFKQSVEKEKDPASADGFSIVHGGRFILVDQKGQMRGFYDSADLVEMERLRTHLAAIAK